MVELGSKSIDPPDDGSSQIDAGEEMARGLVIASGDGTKVLDPADAALDDVAGPVFSPRRTDSGSTRLLLLGIITIVPRACRNPRR